MNVINKFGFFENKRKNIKINLTEQNKKKL